jgi:hypothetical protein
MRIIKPPRAGGPFIPAIALAASLVAGAANAAPQLYENWNTDACGFTDTAVLKIDRPIRLEKIELWMNWGRHQERASYRVLHHGRDIGGGTLERQDCDPYQARWCVAADKPHTSLEPGRYVFRVDRPNVCQNAGSDGEAFMKVYGFWR